MRIKKEHEASLKRQSTNKSKHFSHVMSVPTRNIVDDVTITIPACFGQKEVHPTSASEYLQLVDNYEAAPKFKNSVFKVKKSSSKKTSKKRKSGKGSKKDTKPHGTASSNVYSGAGGGGVHLVQFSTKDSASEAVRFRGQEDEKGYYDLEGFNPQKVTTSPSIDQHTDQHTDQHRSRQSSNTITTTSSSGGSIQVSSFGF